MMIICKTLEYVDHDVNMQKIGSLDVRKVLESFDLELANNRSYRVVVAAA